jgi:outer membrane protein OmpA-like peptidoglycan-associated protein
MIKARIHYLWAPVIGIALVLATSGCATRRYVRNRVEPVNQRVGQLETQTNEQIAAVSAKEQSDISQVNERISTNDQRISSTDTRVTQLSAAVGQAQGTASRAMTEAEANKARIAANTAAAATIASGIANSLNFQLVEKGDVTFAFNKATLTPEAKAALDMIVQKVQALPRAVVELTGFTDKVGSPNYNLALSRRRAEAVERYLVMQKVPLRDIHIVGLGEEAAPPDMPAGGARRVHIKVFGAGDITASR